MFARGHCILVLFMWASVLSFFYGEDRDAKSPAPNNNSKIELEVYQKKNKMMKVILMI